MKLKYYLRGLGIGIVVTALLMGVATKDQGAMSDEEIKMRATELGMVEQRTLADIRDNAVPTETPAVTEAPTAEPVTTEVPSAEPTEEPQETGAPTETPTVTEEPQATEVPEGTETEETTPTEEPEATQPDIEPGELLTIEIDWGDSSEVVSKRLANAGLIESASEFNLYLLNNKLAKVINIGTYEIEMGTSMEKIADIITN